MRPDLISLRTAKAVAFTILLLCAGAVHAADGPRERLLLDFGWKFHLGNDWGSALDLMKAGADFGPAQPNFSDVTWRNLDLPHDWVVELPFDQNAETYHGYKPSGANFPQNNVGWYRKKIFIPKSDEGRRRLWLEFGGVYRDSTVFVNGYTIGRQESGYDSFRYDITDYLNYGATNTIAVRVDAGEAEGWFYEGAGIYRHVWLVKTAPLAVAPDGVFVYSTFKNNIPRGAAAIHLETQLLNSQADPAKAKVTWQIIAPAGKVVATANESDTVESRAAKKFDGATTVSSPILWSPESPNLYTLVTTVERDGKIVDRVETEFGIRTFAFDPDKGFFLNGKPCVIKGTCNHQDHAGVGSALPDRLQYFRVERLKEFGCNAIRTSHNEPTAELLEACDRLGMLVMDENRLLGSSAQNLALMAGQIRRDRNHASVFIWSIGNEEGYATTPVGGQISETMQDVAHDLDPSRRVTYAANVGNVFEGVNRVIDVRGWNYFVGPEMDAYHQAHPYQPEIGTEVASAFYTRGIYARDNTRGYVSAYDVIGGGSTAEVWWKYFADRPWASGSFVWTGFDYRGEPTPFQWPCISSHFGILDTCGFPKDIFYYYQSWWTDKPVLHLLPHWNWSGKEGQDIDVWCFSNCEEVELFLNGQSLGKKTMPRNSHLQWTVKYAPGTLSAKGYSGGRLITETKTETTGEPAAICLAADHPTIAADGEDVSIVTLSVTDAQGRLVPTANNLVHLAINGPGKIIGVGNGDPSCHEPDVYVTKPPTHDISLNEWRTNSVPDQKDRPEITADFDDTNWGTTDVRPEYGNMAANAFTVYRVHVNLAEADMESSHILINFGRIDDDGWIYVNGKLAAESHEWYASPSYEIHSFLHAGDNAIAVIVKNVGGPGGVSKGTSLTIQDKPVPPDWKRSLFNGLAQVIVQSQKADGDIQLVATADGLPTTTIAIHTKPVTPRPVAP
jgi:beta-galactosidase